MKTPLFFEDFTVGMQFDAGSVTIDEAMVRAFSALTGDTNPIHNDPAFMERHPLTAPVVPGMLVAAVAVGSIARLNLTRGSLVALVGQSITYTAPVYIGDSVHTRMNVVHTRPVRKADRGLVTYAFEVRTRNGVVAVRGENAVLLFRKTARASNGESS